jgi:hypothetical protein
MTQTFGQLPKRNPPKPRQQQRAAAGGNVIVLGLLFVFALWPRLWILAYWIFGKQLGDAYSSWVIPAIGFIVLPWTTVLYAWMWAISSDAVNGWEWAVVAVGLVLDLWFWVAAARFRR